MAEVMWEAAEPCLSEEQRLAALTALHVGEPSQALLVVVTALSRPPHSYHLQVGYLIISE